MIRNSHHSGPFQDCPVSLRAEEGMHGVCWKVHQVPSGNCRVLCAKYCYSSSQINGIHSNKKYIYKSPYVCLGSPQTSEKPGLMNTNWISTCYDCRKLHFPGLYKLKPLIMHFYCRACASMCFTITQLQRIGKLRSYFQSDSFIRPLLCSIYFPFN